MNTVHINTYVGKYSFYEFYSPSNIYSQWNQVLSLAINLFKGTVYVISSDHPFIEWHVRFTKVVCKPVSNKCGLNIIFFWAHIHAAENVKEIK